VNALKSITAALALSAAAATANAAAVQYHFAGVFDEETSNFPIAPGGYLFNAASTFTGEFMYDSGATGTLFGDDNFVKAIYQTAVSLLIGSVDGHLFGSAADVTVMSKTCVGACTPPVFLTMNIAPEGTNPLGFSLGGYTLSQWSLQLYSTLTSPDLPQPLGHDDTANLTLTLVNGLDEERSVVFRITDVSPAVSQVPLPGADLLFGASLAGLVVHRLRRRNTQAA